MMRHKGGSFFSRLAVAYGHADDTNRDKIRMTWLEAWREFEASAEEYAERRDQAAAAAYKAASDAFDKAAEESSAIKYPIK